MTSPTPPPREPLSSRITRRLSRDTGGRYIDSEARHTRNVSLAFFLLIGGVLLVVVFALVYGFWENNLKPMASVNGAEIGRGAWQDRQRLEEFRADRAEAVVRAALADGSIDADLGNRRLLSASQGLEDGPAGAMDTLVDLHFQEQLAAAGGITLSDAELEEALDADGTLPAARRVEALVITSDELLVGLPETAESRAQARARAEAALAALQSGSTVADLVDEYSPATADVDGDIGYVVEGDIPDPVFWEALSALDEGGITDIIQTDTGELLIGVVAAIAPALTDPGFREAAASEVGEGVHRRNVELESMAAKLEEAVTSEARAADYEQVRLAQILLAGDTTIDPADDDGSIRARHILYRPEVAPAEDGTEVDVATIPVDDPAWDLAKAEAVGAAGDLRAIADVEARTTAFAERAGTDGDDSTAEVGGDLGFFGRGEMVAEFTDALFGVDDLQRGDIIGPVRTDFGWHVIMFEETRAPLAQRLEAVQAALAADGADFASVAAEHSDGPEASEGGDLGWLVADDLDDLAALALSAVEVGETTEPIDDARGWVIYQKQDEATQPLEPDAAARRARTAFLDWYEPQRFAAGDEGQISVDASVYE